MHFKNSSSAINIVRILYFIICELAGVLIGNYTGGEDKIWLGAIGGALVAAFFILVESLTKKFTLRGFSHATFGLLIGTLLSLLLSKGLISLVEAVYTTEADHNAPIIVSIHIGMFISLGFLGSILALRSGTDDFALLIPYVRFRGETTPGQPLLIDVSILTDSRLIPLLNSGFIDGKIVIPRFIIEELYIMGKAESNPADQALSKRGLQNLDTLRMNRKYDITVRDIDAEKKTHAQENKLIQTCQLISAKLLTTDEDLTKSARLLKINVLNINELNQVLKPSITVGDKFSLSLIRLGKDKTQAIGYLSDGSMIVVNGAADKLNTTQDVIVISTLDTDSGTLIFAELFTRP